MDKVGDNLLTADQVAEYLKLDRETIYRKARRGEIPGIKIGKEWRFSTEGLNNWIKELEKNTLNPQGEDVGRFLSEREKTSQLIKTENPPKQMEKKARKILESFRQRIPKEASNQIKEIHCFGSYARGEETVDSDLDLLVVLNQDDPKLEEQIEETAYQVMWDYDFHPLITIHFLSQDRYQHLSQVNSLFYQRVSEEGVVF